jgi:hypothetical protein
MPKLTKRTVEALGVRATNYIAFDAELSGSAFGSCPAERGSFSSNIAGTAAPAA